MFQCRWQWHHWIARRRFPVSQHLWSICQRSWDIDHGLILWSCNPGSDASVSLTLDSGASGFFCCVYLRLIIVNTKPNLKLCWQQLHVWMWNIAHRLKSRSLKAAPLNSSCGYIFSRSYQRSRYWYSVASVVCL